MKKYLLLLIVPIVVFALWPHTLVKSHNRPTSYALPQSLRTQVAADTRGMNTRQIIDYSVRQTAGLLRFDTTTDLSQGKGNCVGYACLCSAICNCALAANGLAVRSQPVVGHVEKWHINLCAVLRVVAPTQRVRAFVSDHDFVELRYAGHTYYFDPSLYDLLGDDCLTIE